jgi:hypothetical protein
MSKKHTQSEVRKRDIEIAAEEKKIQDLADTPPDMLDDLELLKLMRARGKTVKPKTFEERFNEATPAQRKRMMNKGGYVKAADGIAKKGKTKGRMV